MVINIRKRKIGEGYPTYIIAEMSANHGGDYNRAVEIIYAAKEAGADCIKTQVYTADSMTIKSEKEYFKIKNGPWKGKNLYDLYTEASTPLEWQENLKKEAESIGLDFLATPFDKLAVDLLETINVSAYKISSFEIVDIPLIKYIAQKNKPIIISTGMASLNEIEDAVKAAIEAGNRKLCLLKCSSAYPAREDEMNLKTIQDLKHRFNIPVGLSDHTLGSFSSIIAVALGANVIEKHFCLSRKICTPDSSFSMEPSEFKKMVEDIRKTEKILGKINYEVTESEINSQIFRRSIFAVRNIIKGEYFSEDNVKIIRPGYGLAPKYYEFVLSKKAKTDIKKGTPLNSEMIDENEKI